MTPYAETIQTSPDVAFKPGDHLRVARKFKGWVPYAHHAIYVGDGEVVQFGGEIRDKPNARIGCASVEEFQDGATAELVPHGRYEVVHWLPKADPPDKIVERARWLADRASRSPSQPYNLIGNNCEHIANWCVCGYTESHQFKRALMAVAYAKGVLFLYVSWRVRQGTASRGLVVGALLPNVLSGWAIHVYNREIKRFWEGIRRDWPAHERALSEDDR
jgi:hypothetical protein